MIYCIIHWFVVVATCSPDGVVVTSSRDGVVVSSSRESVVVTISPDGLAVTSSPEELVSVGGGHLGQTCQGSLVLAVTLLGNMFQDLPELH